MWGKYTLICLNYCSLIFLYLWPSITNRIAQDRRLYLKVWAWRKSHYKNWEISVISDSVQIPVSNQSGVEQHKILIIMGLQIRIVAETAGCLFNIYPHLSHHMCPFPAQEQVPSPSPKQSLTEMGKSVISGAVLCQLWRQLRFSHPPL